MSITFNCEADILLWTFPKLLNTCEERKDTFVIHCVWWLATLVQLDSALRYWIEYHQFPSEVWVKPTDRINRQISPTPRDVQNDQTIDITESEIHPNRLSQIDKNNEFSDLNYNTSLQSDINGTLIRTRNPWRRNRDNIRPQSKKRINNAQKLKRLQEDKRCKKQN